LVWTYYVGVNFIPRGEPPANGGELHTLRWAFSRGGTCPLGPGVKDHLNVITFFTLFTPRDQTSAFLQGPKFTPRGKLLLKNLASEQWPLKLKGGGTEELLTLN
jgi:hypothetical protein